MERKVGESRGRGNVQLLKWEEKTIKSALRANYSMHFRFPARTNVHEFLYTARSWIWTHIESVLIARLQRNHFHNTVLCCSYQILGFSFASSGRKGSPKHSTFLYSNHEFNELKIGKNNKEIRWERILYFGWQRKRRIAERTFFFFFFLVLFLPFSPLLPAKKKKRTRRGENFECGLELKTFLLLLSLPQLPFPSVLLLLPLSA